jgi:hypothetical protein
MASSYSVIHDAIKNKRIITARYKGHYREMCPHTLGHKKGRPHALFYQFAGESSSGLIIPGSPNNWRCVFVDELTEVNVRDGQWHTAANHNRPQTCVDQIDIEVAF